MRQSSQQIGQLSGFDRTVVADRIVEFLRALYPVGTAENVCADTGIGIATVLKWLERKSAPSCTAVFRLVGAYGPDFLAAVYPRRLGWLDEAAAAEHRRKIQAQIDELERQKDLRR